MIGLGLALVAGGVAFALAKDRKSQSTPVTESGVIGQTTSGDVIVDTDNGNVATMPREGASTPPDESTAGHTDVIIEMPPMIIERGVQKPAAKPKSSKVPCNCIKAPCGPCDGSTPVVAKPISATGGKGTAPAIGGIAGGIIAATKMPAMNTGIVPPSMNTGSKVPPTPMTKPLPKASISTKGLTKAELGDRVKVANVWAGPMVY